MSYDRKFDAQLTRLSTRLRQAVGAAINEANEGLIKVGQRAARRAAQLTPRSTGPGPHLADAWDVEVQSTANGGLTVDVVNRDPKANAPIALKGGGETTLLRILEFGSRPHEILPVRGDRLVFFWAAVGRVVHARRVFHPGTRPYAMIEIASLEAAVDLKAVLDRLANVLRRLLEGR